MNRNHPLEEEIKALNSIVSDMKPDFYGICIEASRRMGVLFPSISGIKPTLPSSAICQDARRFLKMTIESRYIIRG